MNPFCGRLEEMKTKLTLNTGENRIGTRRSQIKDNPASIFASIIVTHNIIIVIDVSDRLQVAPANDENDIAKSNFGRTNPPISDLFCLILFYQLRFCLEIISRQYISDFLSFSLYIPFIL